MAHSERQEARPGPRAARPARVQNMRRALRDLFTGTSIVERTTQAHVQKSSRRDLPVSHLSSTNITLPHLYRTATAPAILSTSDAATLSSTPTRVHTPITLGAIAQNNPREIQRTMSQPLPTSRSLNHPLVGVDPEEQCLADLAARGRRRQSRRTRGARKRRYCLINFKDRKVRSKVIACCLSSVMLIVILTTYLALALSKKDESQEFHVLLILVILLTTIFFCHSLISLCMVAIYTENEEERPRMSSVGPGGFANPPHPIPVALARDEEAAGIESEATKFPPPAYGLWRESVRVDPNRIFWQHTGTAGTQASQIPACETVLGTQRPPSYISEDGVAYVIEAAQRSAASGAVASLPTHPSERGRANIP